MRRSWQLKGASQIREKEQVEQISATMNMGGAGGRRRVTAPRVASQGRRDREDDLALFRDMLRREKERQTSLLQPVSEEFEPNTGIYPLHIIPSRKKGSGNDLLPREGEKNDYDWLKTPPATPLFPSLEMEAIANNPNLVTQREIPFLKPPRPSGFAGDMEEPKPNSRHKSPVPTSTLSSTASLLTATANCSHPDEATNSNGTPIPRAKSRPNSAAERKPRSRGVSPSVCSRIPGFPDESAAGRGREASAPRGRHAEQVTPTVEAERGRRQSCSPSAARGRGGGAQLEGGRCGVADGRTMQVGNLAFGSRMVEKVMNARRSAAAGGGGGEVKAAKPTKAAAQTKQASGHGSLPLQSSPDTAAKHTVQETRRKSTHGHQRQREGNPKNSAPKSNVSSSASTPRTTPGHEGKEDKNLLKKGVAKHRCGMC